MADNKQTLMEAVMKRFAGEENGAVMVDWVVLTAGLVGLAIAVLASVGGGAADLASRTNGSIETIATKI